MKKYELMTIYKNTLSEQGAKDLSLKVAELIGISKGKVSGNNFWGKRKFAYEIKHAKEGFYDVFNFEMAPADLPKFKTKLNLTSDVLRYLVSASR